MSSTARTQQGGPPASSWGTNAAASCISADKKFVFGSEWYFHPEGIKSLLVRFNTLLSNKKLVRYLLLSFVFGRYGSAAERHAIYRQYHSQKLVSRQLTSSPIKNVSDDALQQHQGDINSWAVHTRTVLSLGCSSKFVCPLMSRNWISDCFLFTFIISAK
jgi:hypothetical protein